MVNLINTSRFLAGRFLAASAGAAFAVMLILPANAIEYSYGEVSGSLDTIVSVGASMRTSNRSCENVGKANGGCQGFDASGIDHTFGGTTQNTSTDDGNLNYDQWDVFSGNTKATSELLANYKNFNMFVRGTAFYDALVDETDFRDLDHDAKSRVEHDYKLLDYFVGGNFDIGGRPVDFRLGNQVISWGESTFIQNGINVINPVDVAALRKPGSEIKEFFIPVLAAKGSIGLPGNISAEAFYQFKSENIEPDANGSYFSGADAVGPNSQPLRLGASDLGDDNGVLNRISLLRGLDLDGHFNPTVFGASVALNTICAAPTLGQIDACGGSAFAAPLIIGAEAFNGFATPINQAYGALPLLVNTSSATIERRGDVNADDGGEYGFALRYFSETLNQGMEFGFFAMNVHSRLPLLSLSVINPATGYAVGTPGFNQGQFSARGFADIDLDGGPNILLGAGPGATQAQADAVNAANAQAAALFGAGVGQVGNGGLPAALTGFLAGVGTGAGNLAVDAFEIGQFTCNVLAPTNGGARIGRGVGSANASSVASVAGNDLSLPGGYTNCNNATRLRRGFDAQLDRVLLALPVQTMTFRLEYPEDIQLFGLSANTTIGPLAVQGEIAYRHDQPLQYALGEQVRAALDRVGGTAFVTGAASTVDVDGDGDVDDADFVGANGDHTVADLAANDGVASGVNYERGKFEPLDAQVQRATAARSADYASLGVSTGLCDDSDTRCTFGDVGVIEGFASFTGALSSGQITTLGGPAAFQCAAGPCGSDAAVNASGGRTYNLAAAADLAATGSLTAGTPIGVGFVTAEQAATWNALGFIILDPLQGNVAGTAVDEGWLGNSVEASYAVISAMPNDMIFARHADFNSPAAAIQQGSVIDQSAFGSDGYIKAPLEDVFTAQTTLTSLLYGSNPVVEFLSADSGVTVTEFGAVWVPGIDTSDGYSSTNTVGLANETAGDVYKLNSTLANPANFATSFSYGAQGIFNFTYNRVFGSPINLVPQVSWRWDLGGRTPGPLGNYMSQRKALGLSVGANYQNRWTGNLSWTMNFGPDAPLNDRDFAAATISYSF